MRRTPALAALALAAAAALPAHADYPPTECEAHLVLAAAGQAAGCTTIGATYGTGATRRVLDVYVQTGQVTASLSCGGDGYHNDVATATTTVTAPYHGQVSVDRTSYCWATITATVDGTTAVATNTGGRTVDVAS
jgi:hypothetical protein